MIYNVYTMNKTAINIRIDEQLKKDVEKILSNIGVSLSAAVIMYLKTVVRTGSIPFDLVADPAALKSKSVSQSKKTHRQAKVSFEPIKSEKDESEIETSEALKKAIDELW